MPSGFDIGSIQIWPLLAGLGLFLFGLSVIEESLGILIGRHVKNFLRTHTRNPIKAVLTGAAVTAILQSSTLVTLLVMSFTSAGIIALKSGIGIILGANLGTTFTGWLISLLGFKLNIQEAVLPLLAIGGLGTLLIKSSVFNQLCRFLMGFSFMFLGLGYMKDGFAEFAATIDFGILEGQPMVYLLVFGFFLAAMLHSSSACMVIYLSVLSAGLIDLTQAFYLVIGSDLGTTMTGLVGTVGGNSIRKRTGWAQFYINLISGTLAIFMMNPLSQLIVEIMMIKDPLISLVTFHSIFNTIGILTILPFLAKFTQLLEKNISSKKHSRLKFVAEINPKESLSSLFGLEKEVSHFVEQTIVINKTLIDSADKNTDNHHLYSELKKYENELNQFVLKIQRNHLNDSEAKRYEMLSSSLRYSTLSAKDIKDVLHNLEYIKDSEDPLLIQFYLKLFQLQSEFYIRISSYLKEQDEYSRNLEVIKSNIKRIHHLLSESMVVLSESITYNLDYSSIMNLMHEINNSNEYLYRSIELLSEVKLVSSNSSNATIPA
ncbi:MAG: Na/Pi symporter [Saprospiraceae bacterium]|nr:Na/Pi symporter [Saprospiraceae bacterium]